MQILDDDDERPARRNHAQTLGKGIELFALRRGDPDLAVPAIDACNDVEDRPKRPDRGWIAQPVADAPTRARERAAKLRDEARFAESCITAEQHEPTARRARFASPFVQISELLTPSNERLA